MSLPAGTYSPASITLMDAGNEPGLFKCYGPVLTAANFAASETLWSTLITAIAAITLGAISKRTYGTEVTTNWAQQTNGASRETKLLVQYADATNGQRLTCTVPTLDPTLPVYVLNINARDVVQTDQPDEITDFIAAFEAFAVPPLNPTHAVNVVGLKVVGRNT